MTKPERLFWDWVKRHAVICMFITVTVVAYALRYLMLPFLSIDANEWLLPWYDTISERGGFNALYEQVGNYNIPYQILIAAFTYFPFLSPLTAYKLLSGAFDLLLALACGYYFFRENKKRKALLAYSLVLLSPTVLLNSSCWAQCDSIYVFFSIVAMLLVMDDKYIAAFVMLGLSFSFKLQAVFILPLFFLIYVCNIKFSILHFFIAPATMLLTSAPALLRGRPISDIANIYLGQSGEYPYMYLNYPSVWALLFDKGGSDYFTSFSKVATVFAFAVLLCYLFFIYASDVVLNRRTLLYCSFLLSYTCVFFLPAMHERYAYMPEILSLLIAICLPRTIPAAVVLHIVTMPYYAGFLFAHAFSPSALIYANIATYVYYAVVLLRELRTETNAAKADGTALQRCTS